MFIFVITYNIFRTYNTTIEMLFYKQFTKNDYTLFLLIFKIQIEKKFVKKSIKLYPLSNY